MGVTPCFRDDEIDNQHNKCFIKLELIKIFDKRIAPVKYAPYDVLEIANHALEFFNKIGNVANGINRYYYSIQDDNQETFQLDVVRNLNNGEEIEVGSYGYRELKGTNWQWIYGTGLALPRFTQSMYWDLK